MSSHTLSEGDFNCEQQFDQLLHKVIVKNSGIFYTLENKRYRFLRTFDLVAVQVSKTKLDVFTLANEKPLHQCTSNNNFEILDFCWIENGWKCGEVCLCLLLESGLQLIILKITPNFHLIKSGTSESFYVWKELPGILSIEGARDEYVGELVCSGSNNIVILIRRDTTSSRGGRLILWKLGRNEDINFGLSVTISSEDILHIGHVWNHLLYIVISHQLSIHDIDRTKILYKLDISEVTYLTNPRLLIGNDKHVIFVDESDAFHLINWDLKRNCRKEDPWHKQLENILEDAIPEKKALKFANDSTLSIALSLSPTDISFCPMTQNPDNVIITSQQDDIHLNFLLFDLHTASITSTLSLSERFILVGYNPMPLGCNTSQLAVVIPNVDVNSLLEKILVYRSAEVASCLSVLNDRPSVTISHSSLSHALTYQQIESVNFCLNRLLSGAPSSEDVIQTCRELVSRCSNDDSRFARQVAQLGVMFISQVVNMELVEEAISHSMSELRGALFKELEEETWWFGDSKKCTPQKSRYRLSHSTRTESSDKTVTGGCLHGDDVIPVAWYNMSNKDVIKESVLRGNVGLAQYFLIAEKDRLSPSSGKFEDIVQEILIEFLKEQDLPHAKTVMTNMMMDSSTTLKDICITTPDVALCTYLVSVLPGNIFTKQELEGERFLRQLNSLNQNISTSLELEGAENTVTLQLDWITGWKKDVQDMIICEAHKMSPHGTTCPREIPTTIARDYHIWQCGSYLKECDISLLKDLFMMDKYFSIPTSNQTIIQNRMILEDDARCNFEEYIHAVLDTDAEVILKEEYLQTLLERSLELKLFTFPLLLLQDSKISTTNVESPEFQLIKCFVDLIKCQETGTMFSFLLLMLERCTPSLNSLSTNHPLSVLALALYSTKSVSELLADPDVVWCDAEQLKHSLTQYPKLQSTLFPELNIEHPPPSVKDVLNAFKTWRDFGLDYDTTQSLTDEELMQKFGKETTADYRFYLQTGRPFYAYMSITYCTTPVNKDEILNVIYDLSMDNATDHSFIASAVIVTDLLDPSFTEVLVLAIQIARLLLHNKYYSCSETDETIRNWIKNRHVDNLLPYIMSALRTRSSLPRFEGQLLLHMFCRKGSIDIICKHDSWLDMAWNLHAWQVEKQQAIKVIEQCEPALRLHISQIIYYMEKKTHGCLERVKYRESCGLFSKIVQCLIQENPVERLLSFKNMPFTIVLAATFHSVRKEEMMIRWIRSQISSLSDQLPDELTTLDEVLPFMYSEHLEVLEKALTIFHPKSHLLPFISLTTSLQKCKEPKEIPKASLKALTNWFDELLPNVTVVHEFIIKMLGYLITSSATNYHQFYSVQALAKYALHRIIAVPNFDRLSLLKEVLQEARMSLRLHHVDVYTATLTTSYVHRSIFTAILEDEADACLEQMLSNGQYDLARKFAQIVGYKTADAISKQINNQLLRFKQSPLWNNSRARQRFWSIISNRFELFTMELGVEGPIIKAQFYLLEGCNACLDGIERAYLINHGLSALLTIRPQIVGKTQAEKLMRFYWSTVAVAYKEAEKPDTSYFNPISDVQEWEVVELSKKVKGPNFPDYHYESNAEINSIIHDFVGRFLDDGRLFRAEKLSKLFDIQVPDMGIIRICRDLAEEYITIPTIPAPIKSMIRQQYTTISQTTVILVDDADMNELMIEGWSFKKKVRNSANQEFDEPIQTTDDWQESTGTSFKKEYNSLEEIYIGDLIGSYLVYGSCLSEMYSTFYKMSKEQGIVYRNNLSTIKYLEQLIRYNAKINVIQTFIKQSNHSHSNIVKLVVRLVKAFMESPTFEKELTLEGFRKLASLASRPGVLADVMWRELLPQCNVENVIRILIFIHYCYTLANCTDGRLKVLEFCRKKSNDLAYAGYCNQLVDLFFEANQYSDMLYLCDAVYNHNKFKLFLEHPGASRKPQFQSALLAYLEQHHPDDSINKELLCQHFNKDIEVARMYDERARVLVQDRTASVVKLEDAIKRYTKAAQHYKLAQAYEKYVECIQQARLVGLQITFKKKSAALNIMNLSKDEVHNFLSRHPIFLEAYILARAYQVVDLVPYVFRAAILNDNMDYFEDYATVFQLDVAFFETFATLAQKTRKIEDVAIKNLVVVFSACKDINLRKNLAQRMSLPAYR